ncbi:MAG: YeeE/YedE thiosulfate transporter family protein [Paracoccus sp. (in: a-proteobacteria)]|nr:YeeE/YedE thiosulfate transporter family protein [Paracoccus sp. (in: a-proteobacteria)]
MTEFTPFQSLLGGALIGLAAVLLMLVHGRVAGLSGIVSGAILGGRGARGWQIAFLSGAVAAPLIAAQLFGATIAFDSPAPLPLLVAGGVLVGIGVTIGNGCSSGHGVCGMARLSRRSIAATLIFMASTGLTLFVIRHIWGLA